VFGAFERGYARVEAYVWYLKSREYILLQMGFVECAEWIDSKGIISQVQWPENGYFQE
jgi:predicted nucleic acid-binding Zn finger protein